MKKNYFFTLFVLLLSSLSALGQITANNDSYTINGLTGGSSFSVRHNDIIYGNTGIQVACAMTILSQVSTTNPGVTMNTVCGAVNVAQGTPAGTYYIEYQICLADMPAVCDTATVTVTVCEITPPVIDGFTPLGCLADISTITLSGLPAGNWSLSYQNTINSPVITGSGPTATLNFPMGTYTFRVTNDEGCTSAPVWISIFPPQEIIGELLPVYVDTNSDGIVNIGDEVHYTISLTNMSECPITDIGIQEASLNFTGGPIPFLAPGATDNTTFSGVAVLTQQDINNGTVSNYAFISGDYDGGEAYTKAFGDFTLPVNDGIHMIAFIDSNGNGIMDTGEEEFNSGEFTYQVNDGDIIHAQTGMGHHTVFETNPANMFTIGYEINNTSCAGEYSIATDSYSNITVPALSGLTNYYFAITAEPCTDLEAYIYGPSPVPGAAYYNTIIIRNNGNQTIASGSFEFVKDPVVTIASISEAGVVPTATGFTYAFTNLLPGHGISIMVVMDVPAIPAVNLGDILTASVTASIPAGDIEPENNSFVYNQIVIGAYDPNDKGESHGREIVFDDFTANDYLTYTIRFENVGTANAHVVRIDDVLSDLLDANTVRMVAASHDYVMERNGNSLEWVFNGIELPPSVEGTATGKGFVVFQVKPMPDYEVGTTIENTADIYFDTNPVIVTNTVITEFVETLGTPNFAAQNIVAYPNPVTNILYFENLPGTGTIEVYNQLGQLVVKQEQGGSQIDLSGINTGVYMVKLKAGFSVKTIKIVKD